MAMHTKPMGPSPGVWALLAGAVFAGGSDARTLSALPADSIRLAGPVEVRGGGVLSTRDARARLVVGAGGRPVSCSALEMGLAALGEMLLGAGHVEARLVLEVDSAGAGTLWIDQGPAARWDTLGVTAPVPVPFPGPPRPGAPLDAARLERAMWSWVDAATEDGYPFAAARVESVTVRDGRVRAGVRLDSGPRCRVEEVAFPGRITTRESFLHRWIRFRPGRPYRESEWTAARRRLEQLGLFAAAGEPVVELRPDGGLRVVLPVQEVATNRVEGAVGYSGQKRAVTGLVDLELGNLFGTARRLAVRWERLQPQQSRLRLEARDPMLGPFPLGGRLSLQQEVRDSTYTTAVLELVGEASLGRDFTALAGVEWRRSILGPEPAARHRRLSSVFGGRWNSERPGSWTGGRLELAYRSGRTRVHPAGGGPRASYRLDRAEGAAERFLGLGGMVARFGVKAEAISRTDSLPLAEALRFGGGAELRGFADEALTARRFAAGQMELGPAWGDTRAYLFVDAAVWRPLDARGAEKDALSFGIGLMQASARRRVGFDLAIPRGGSVAEGRLHARVERRF